MLSEKLSNGAVSSLARKAEKQALRELLCLSLTPPAAGHGVGVSGLLNKQVGEELGISEITVKAHRGQVMQKMQANSLADLVKMAGRLGLAKGRETAMLRDHADRTGFPGGQLIGSYAFVA